MFIRVSDNIFIAFLWCVFRKYHKTIHVNVNFCDFFHRYVLCFTPNDIFASFFYIFKLKSKANSLMPRYVYCGIQVVMGKLLPFHAWEEGHCDCIVQRCSRIWKRLVHAEITQMLAECVYAVYFVPWSEWNVRLSGRWRCSNAVSKRPIMRFAGNPPV